jgi:hypothetical protein
MKPAECLHELRRGEGDVLELVMLDGTVLLLHAHGVTLDEQMRTKERALQVLRDALNNAPSRPLR